MANSVTFPMEYGGSGITITDDADPTTGLDGTGYIERFVPALQQTVAMTGHAVLKAGEADSSAQTASAAAQQASNDRDSINLDLQTLNGLVSDADASATAAAGSATTASNMADAVAQATATYTSVSAGLADTVDTNYFRVIEAPDASRVSVYRNDAGSATLITTYYTKTGVDAKQAAAVRLNRSLQRLGDNGQTLHSDFNLAAYGLGTPLFGGVQDAMEAEELWEAQRATSKYVLQHTADGSVKYREVPVDTLAREYNPETSEYAALIEGSATNVLLYSAQFGKAYWGKIAASIAQPSIPSIIGSNPVSKLIEDTSTGTHSLDVSRSVEAGKSYTLSFFLKSSERTEVAIIFATAGFGNNTLDFFDVAAGSVVNNVSGGAKITSEVGGWYRVSVTRTATSTSSSTFQLRLSNGTSTEYTGDGTSGIYIAHAQLEQGARPTSPIITTDAPVTRAADSVSRVLGAEFNASEGTLIWRGAPSADIEISQVVFGVSDGTVNNRTLIRVAGSGSVQMISSRNGVLSTSSVAAQFTPGDSVSIGLSFGLSGWRYSVNGSIAVEKTDVSGPVTATLMHASNGPASNQYNGSTEYQKYIPVELTAAQLQELTL